MLYWFARTFLKLLFGVFFRFEVIGAENVPARGAVVLACNHRSYVDPLLLVVRLRRRLTFLTKSVRYRFPLNRPVCAAAGVIALRIEKGAPGMKHALDLLRAGRPMVIFPEGTRNLTRRPFLPGKPGVAWLADTGRAPVVPVYIGGSDRVLPPRARIFRPGAVRLVFGRPFRYDGDPYLVFSRRVMAEIARLAAG